MGQYYKSSIPDGRHERKKNRKVIELFLVPHNKKSKPTVEEAKRLMSMAVEIVLNEVKKNEKTMV